MAPASGLANATSVHRQVDDLLLDLGGVSGVAVIQQAGAPVASHVLATAALLALAGGTVSDDLGALAVRAMLDWHAHGVTRLGWGLR
jgi:hypothetical protein